MNLKSFFKKLFFGYEVLEKIDSPVNGEITVMEDLFGGKEMRVGGATQSGGLVERLWKTIFNLKFETCLPAGKVFNHLQCKQFSKSNVLILGLGCGTVARLISEKFPKAKITGIEIDPVVVEMGKKYFGLGEINNLEVVVADALKLRSEGGKWEMCREVRSEKWDLILIDLYVGKGYPKEAESKEFITGVGNLLSEGGMAIFNRLSYGEYDQPANEFSEKLRQYFSKVFTKRAVTNLLIFCQE